MICSRMLIIALFTIVKNCKQHKCPSTGVIYKHCGLCVQCHTAQQWKEWTSISNGLTAIILCRANEPRLKEYMNIVAQLHLHEVQKLLYGDRLVSGGAIKANRESTKGLVKERDQILFRSWVWYLSEMPGLQLSMGF